RFGHSILGPSTFCLLRLRLPAAPASAAYDPCAPRLQASSSYPARRRPQPAKCHRTRRSSASTSMARDPDGFQLPSLTVPPAMFEYEEGSVTPDHIVPDCERHQMVCSPTMPLRSKWVYKEREEDLADYFEDEDATSDYIDSDDEKMEFWDGEARSPSVELMTQNLQPDAGKPPSLLAKPWCCPKCKEVYPGIRNFICDTQQYACYKCKIKNPTCQSWSLTRVTLNGVLLDFFKVFQQGKTDQCILYSFLALCDMMRRIRGAKLGGDEAMPFEPAVLRDLYETHAGFKMGNPPSTLVRSPTRPGQHVTVQLILEVAVLYGVPYSAITRFDNEHSIPHKPLQGVRIPLRTLKVKSWFRISMEDVCYIIRVLGHGIPLMAVVPIGKCFDFMPNGQIYHAPLPKVVLVIR
ncbi:hypothetical protein EJB05_19666, partial [Eragrostis curvula]